MDKSMNLVVLNGKLAAPAEIRQFESGSRLIRYLLTVRSEEPRRRVDVIPVTLWDPSEELVRSAPGTGAPLWMTGTVQRRFWEGVDGRRSRLEIIAAHVAENPEPAVQT
jgi:single-strand DNA-binding protein